MWPVKGVALVLQSILFITLIKERIYIAILGICCLGGVFFLTLQQVLIFSATLDLNDKLVECAELDDRGANSSCFNGYAVFLLILLIASAIGAAAGYLVHLVKYPLSRWESLSLITILIVQCVLTFHPKIRSENTSASILPPSVTGMANIWLLVEAEGIYRGSQVIGDGLAFVLGALILCGALLYVSACKERQIAEGEVLKISPTLFHLIFSSAALVALLIFLEWKPPRGCKSFALETLIYSTRVSSIFLSCLAAIWVIVAPFIRRNR